MIYPSIDKLLTIINSKYKLVHVVAERSREMKEHKHYQMSESKYKSKRVIGRTLEEIAEGLVHIN